MKVLVLEELAAEIALHEQSSGIRSERQANERREPDDWHIYRVNAADAKALDLGLGLKADGAAAEVVLLHLGPPDAEHWMRAELARGCDSAIRVWDDDLVDAHTQAKALVLASAVRSCGFDLVLTGTANAASAGGQLGVLLARHLGVPCVTQASIVNRAPDQQAVAESGADRLHVTRDLAGGYQEKVEVALPAVVTVVASKDSGMHLASVSDMIRALDTEFSVWDLATLGVPRVSLQQADGALRLGDLRAPRPRLRFIVSPDSSSPAFNRILQIVGGVVERREGRVVHGEGAQVAEEIFKSLRDEGWLDHLHCEVE